MTEEQLQDPTCSVLNTSLDPNTWLKWSEAEHNRHNEDYVGYNLHRQAR